MPTQEEVFASIVQSVRTGAGMDLDADAVAALRVRYFEWIEKAGEKEGKPFPTPLDVWEQVEGANLRRQFERIGRQAAAKSRARNKSQVSEVETLDEALIVEADSDCPWCRPPGG